MQGDIGSAAMITWLIVPRAGGFFAVICAPIDATVDATEAMVATVDAVAAAAVADADPTAPKAPKPAAAPTPVATKATAPAMTATVFNAFDIALNTPRIWRD